MRRSTVAVSLRLMSVFVVVSSLGLALLALPGGEARAIPSFARQTGAPCSACHTAFPELTPFGRQFKLNGYVTGAGTPWYTHFSGMLQPSFTHTDKDQPGPAADHFGENNNLALQQASLFYGGKLLDHLGMFSQLTYDGVGRVLSWDNTEFRMADTGSISGRAVTYGITVNNNPSVQDLWNTTPAWGYPYAGSSLAPTPAAGTLIEGALAQQVGGAGGYALFDNLLYVELSGYRTLSHGTQRFFGVDTSDEDKIDGTAPYWRVALQHDWGPHSLEVGTFGLDADTFPGGDKSAGADHRTDVGVDAQYQYLGGVHGLTFQTSWIHEDQQWDASRPLGNTANANDVLRSFKARLGYLYDKTYELDLAYFDLNGDTDPVLYGDSRKGSPDSNGWIFELNYLPFNKSGGPSWWPWLNLKLSLQYVLYDAFDGSSHNIDGTGRNAGDNNTLYLLGWLAF
jgi:hypothetical protein